MNSSFSRPAIYVKAKGPGVFQAISFPQGPPSHYNFHQVVQFSGSHPRGAYASSNKSVYATSLGTVPVGAWFVLLMRLGFLVGGGKQQSCYRSAVGHLFPQQSMRTSLMDRMWLSPLSAVCGPAKAFAMKSWPLCPSYQRATLVYKGLSSKCFHLALIGGCRLGKSHRLGQMVSVEGETTTCVPSPGSHSFLCQR